MGLHGLLQGELYLFNKEDEMSRTLVHMGAKRSACSVLVGKT
jgi:hypothetical protein